MNCGACLSLLALVVLWSSAGSAQSAPIAEFSAWARSYAITLPMNEQELSAERMKAFDSLLATARVVALGEPFHGAHEPLALRNQLIRYLVSQKGVRAIALETALTPSRRLYEYVSGLSSESDSAAATAFSYGFGELGENRALLRWLRKYNAIRPAGDRVGLYGIDLTGQMFPTAYQALEPVLAYLDRASPGLGASTRQALAASSADFRFDRYPLLSESQKDHLSGQIRDLVSFLVRNRPEFVDGTSLDEYDWALRQAINAAQDDAFLRVASPDLARLTATLIAKAEAGEGLDSVLLDSLSHDPSAGEVGRMREAAMAENVHWVLDRAPSRRVVFFAHNGHITRVMPDSSVADPLPIPTAGVYLRAQLGSGFVAIGCYYGVAEGFPTDNRTLAPSRDGIDGLLASLQRPAYFVNLHQLPASGPLTRWFRSSQDFRGGNFGDSRSRYAPARAYDGLVYVGRLTPSFRH